MKFHFSIAAWGDAFLEVLTQVHLPSLLAPGNLPTFLERYPLEYRLYTTPEDAKSLARLKGFRDFRRVIPTKVIPVPGLDFSDVHHSHRVFNELMRLAMRDAVTENAYLLMNNPDTCWGNGSFRHVAKLISEGWCGILNSAIRSDSRRFMAKAREQFKPAANGALVIPNRDLVKLGWETMHPYQKATVWGQPNTSAMPAPVITPVEGQGFILNMAHMGSLCVISDALCQDFEQTTDGDYINRVFADYSDIHVLEDSDDVCVMELSDPERYVDKVIPGVPLNEQQVAEFLLSTASWETHSLENFRRCLRYHWCEIDTNRWRKIEVEVETRVEAILNRRQILSWIKLLENEPDYHGFVSLVRALFAQAPMLRNDDRFRRRLFLVPEKGNLRELLEGFKYAPALEAADLDKFLRSLVLDLPDNDDRNITATAWSGKKFHLIMGGSKDPLEILSVNGVPVRKKVVLEDALVLFLDPGLDISTRLVKHFGTKRRNDRPERKKQASPLRQPTKFQRALIGAALWNSILGGSALTSRAHFIDRFLLHPRYGKRLLFFLRRAQGTGTNA